MNSVNTLICVGLCGCSQGDTYSVFASVISLEPDSNPSCLCVGTSGNPAAFLCAVPLKSPMCPYSNAKYEYDNACAIC